MAEKNPIAEAIAESAANIRGVDKSIDMEKRKAWTYIAESTISDWAKDQGIEETSVTDDLVCQYLKRQNAIIRVGKNFRGAVLYAVWNYQGDPYIEPEFDG